MSPAPRVKPKPCPYCSNPDVATWPLQCQFVGGWGSRADFAASSFDPPCALDAYDEDQRELERENRKAMAAIIAIVLGSMVMFALLLGGLFYSIKWMLS